MMLFAIVGIVLGASTASMAFATNVLAWLAHGASMARGTSVVWLVSGANMTSGASVAKRRVQMYTTM